MTEIEINRASQLIDPQLHIWGIEVPIYLFLGGLTAGLMILTPLLLGRTPPAQRTKWMRWLPLVAPLILSFGMLALLIDLSYKLHALRFYAAFRPASPMSWGAWILIAIYPATLLLGLATLDDNDWRWVSGRNWIKKIGVLTLAEAARRFALNHTGRIRIVNIVLGIGLGGYTGLLLSTLGVRHVWSSAVLGPLFLVSGISTGAALMMLWPLGEKSHPWLRKVDIAAIVTELALLALYLVGLSSGNTAANAAAQLFLGGPYTATFWSLVVFAGLLIPLFIELFEARKRIRPTVWAPVLLLLGGFCLRLILVSAGQV